MWVLVIAGGLETSGGLEIFEFFFLQNQFLVWLNSCVLKDCRLVPLRNFCSVAILSFKCPILHVCLEFLHDKKKHFENV